MRRTHSHAVKKHTYTNIVMVVIGVLIAIMLSKYEPFHAYILQFGTFGYFGAFVAGILFVSTFTAATSALVLLILAERLSPIELGLIAGLGAVIGDLTIFHIYKDGLFDEIYDIYGRFGGKRMSRILHVKAFRWMLPVIGAIIVASPFPDEIGISLLGLSKMSTSRFIVLSYVLNSIGIFLIVSASIFIKP